MQDLLLILLGFLGLFLGGDGLVKGASRVAQTFKISPLIIGLTIVAMGTSVPELLVSIQAASRGVAGISLGNVIGSNIANIGLILGLTGAIATMTVHRSLVWREIPIMIAVTLLASLLTLDGELSRIDGIILFSTFVLVTGWFYRAAQQEPDQTIVDIDELEIADPNSIKLSHEMIRIAISTTALMLGSNFLIEGASNFARAIGVSDLVIGVTMVAIGTSLPEMAASLTATFKKENDIAVGNIIGSNIVNLLVVLGLTVIVKPIDVGQTDLSIVEFIVMIGFSVIMLPIMRNHEISRLESAVLVGAYIAFIIYSFATGSPVAGL